MSLGTDFRFAWRSLYREKGLAGHGHPHPDAGHWRQCGDLRRGRGVWLRPLVNKDEDRLIDIRQILGGAGAALGVVLSWPMAAVLARYASRFSVRALDLTVPVVASNVGGLPETIDDGVSGFLCPPDAADAMADRGVELLTDEARHESIARAAAEVVRSRYCAELIVPLYEKAYENGLRGRGAPGHGG